MQGDPGPGGWCSDAECCSDSCCGWGVCGCHDSQSPGETAGGGHQRETTGGVGGEWGVEGEGREVREGGE